MNPTEANREILRHPETTRVTMKPGKRPSYDEKRWTAAFSSILDVYD